MMLYCTVFTGFSLILYVDYSYRWVNKSKIYRYIADIDIIGIIHRISSALLVSVVRYIASYSGEVKCGSFYR